MLPAKWRARRTYWLAKSRRSACADCSLRRSQNTILIGTPALSRRPSPSSSCSPHRQRKATLRAERTRRRRTYAGGRATGSLAISAALKPSVERPSPSRGRGRGAAFPSSLRWETMISSTGSTSESGSSSSRRWAFSRVVMAQRVVPDPLLIGVAFRGKSESRTRRRELARLTCRRTRGKSTIGGLLMASGASDCIPKMRVESPPRPGSCRQSRPLTTSLIPVAWAHTNRAGRKAGTWAAHRWSPDLQGRFRAALAIPGA